jgi:AcrR family transcriptional regulator
MRGIEQAVNPGPTSPAEPTMRARIIKAAFQEFMENGYAGASTLGIARRARVSKRDLYASFPNKQAVLLACITDRAARMRLPSDMPAPRSREMLVSILRTFGATVVTEVCQPAVVAMFRLAICEAKRSPDVAEALHISRLVNRGALAGLITQAQAAGILDPGNPHEMTEQFFALLWGDLMLSRLLGVAASPKAAEIDRRAKFASEAFLKLYDNSIVDAR